MSDARAKAEARRAKILARDKKQVSAVPTTEEEDLLLSLGESKSKDRPLAARRNLIESKNDESNISLDSILEDVITPSTTATAAAISVAAVSPDNTSISPIKSKESESNVEELESPTKKQYKLPPKKTLEEIEKEVAENTKRFDERTLGKPDDNQDKDNKEGKKKDQNKKDDNKGDDEKNKTTTAVEDISSLTSSEKLKKAKLKLLANKQVHIIDPSTGMRLLRLLLILSVAIFIGYRIVHKNRLAALLILQQQQQESLNDDEFDMAANTDINYLYNTIGGVNDLSNPQGRTWIQYFQYRMNNQLESSVSAILFIYWISKMFTPAINAVFKAPKAKQSNPLNMIFEFLQTGLSGWMESVYTVLGEVSLHLFTLIMSVLFFTVYYSNNQIDNNNPTSVNPLMNQNDNNEL